MALRYYQPGDYDNTILRKLLENQTQLILGTLTLATTGGGGGGAVDSVNGETGVVVLDAIDVGASPAFSDSPSLAALVGDTTGTTGVFVLNTNPTLIGFTLTGASVVEYTAMPALAVNIAKPGNTYSATGDVAFTYSNATPTAGTRTFLKISADGTARTITIPETWSLTRGGNITSLLVAASTTLAVMLEYTGARWEIYGDPVATTGTGNYVLATSPTLVTPNLGTPSALVLTNATGLPVAGGGTGVASFTAYAPIFGGTTGTGAVQSGTVGTAGQVLTSNGAGALPTFQAASAGSTAWGSTVGEGDLASAATTDLDSVTDDTVRITGTTTITSFGTAPEGTARIVRFAGALTLTYNASTLILPGSADITTAAGDALIACAIDSAGAWKVVGYWKQDGTPLYVGNLIWGTNAGAVTLSDMPVTAASPDNTEMSYALKIDGQTILKVYAQSDGAGSVDNTRIEVNGAPLLSTLSAYAAGTVYTLTNTAAALDFGTTDPSITIPYAGTWKISARVQLAYTGATVVAETATLKLRRTNNTAADLTSSSTTIDLLVATTETYTYGVIELPPVYYSTLNANDVVTIFGNVSATLGAGTITAEVGGTNITAERLF